MDERTATDREHDLQDASTCRLIMAEIDEHSEERLKLMPLADVCDLEEEKQFMVLIVGVGDVRRAHRPESHWCLKRARQ